MLWRLYHLAWWPQRLLAFLHAPDLMAAAGVSLVDARGSVSRTALERPWTA